MLNVIWSRSFFYICHFEIFNWLIRCMRIFKFQLKSLLPICRFTEMSWKSTVLSSNPAPPSSWKTSSWLQLRETATWLSPSTIWWNYTRWNDLSRLLHTSDTVQTFCLINFPGKWRRWISWDLQAHEGGHRESDEGRRRCWEKDEDGRKAAFAGLLLRAEGAVFLQCYHISGIDAGKRFNYLCFS